MEKISSLFKRDTIFFIDEEKVCTDREVLQIIGKLLLEKGYVKESFGNALIEREEKYRWDWQWFRIQCDSTY